MDSTPGRARSPPARRRAGPPGPPPRPSPSVQDAAPPTRTRRTSASRWRNWKRRAICTSPSPWSSARVRDPGRPEERSPRPAQARLRIEYRQPPRRRARAQLHPGQVSALLRRAHPRPVRARVPLRDGGDAHREGGGLLADHRAARHPRRAAHLLRRLREGALLLQRRRAPSPPRALHRFQLRRAHGDRRAGGRSSVPRPGQARQAAQLRAVPLRCHAPAAFPGSHPGGAASPPRRRRSQSALGSLGAQIHGPLLSGRGSPLAREQGVHPAALSTRGNLRHALLPEDPGGHRRSRARERRREGDADEDRLPVRRAHRPVRRRPAFLGADGADRADPPVPAGEARSPAPSAHRGSITARGRGTPGLGGADARSQPLSRRPGDLRLSRRRSAASGSCRRGRVGGGRRGAAYDTFRIMDFIAGSWSETDAPDGAIEDRSPADLSMLLGRFPWAIGQAERAVQAAREAQPGFGALPQQDRARLVRRVGAILKEREDQLANAIALDVGKPLWEARLEAQACAAKAAITVDEVLFTGSWSVGQAIERANQGQTKLLALEMGGKNAAVVLADADVEKAAYDVLFSAFVSAGQRCTAASRAIVVGDARAFAARIAKLAEKLSIGHPLDDGVFMGPLASSPALEKFEQGVRGSGAETLLQSRRLAPRGLQGCYASPSVHFVEQRRGARYE